VTEFTDHQFAAIGRVVIETARLEAVVREAIWRALCLDSGQGRLVTACMARPEQLHALRALGGRFFEWHELDEYIRLVATIEAVLLERDFILRAQWGFLMKDVIAVAATWLDNDGGEHTLTRSFPFPRLDTLSREALAYGADLKKWMARFTKSGAKAVATRKREPRKTARTK
jgi:hypothetical protein